MWDRPAVCERVIGCRWNQLDLAIVALSVAGIILEEMDTGFIPINPTIIRVMRVLRIARGSWFQRSQMLFTFVVVILHNSPQRTFEGNTFVDVFNALAYLLKHLKFYVYLFVTNVWNNYLLNKEKLCYFRNHCIKWKKSSCYILSVGWLHGLLLLWSAYQFYIFSFSSFIITFLVLC